MRHSVCKKMSRWLLPAAWRGAGHWYAPDAWCAKAADYGGDFGDFSKPQRANIIDWIMQLQDDHESMLDVSSFHGHYIEALRARGYRRRYTGIDITPKFIATARRRMPGEDFRLGDARRLQFAEDAFDLVLATGVLMYLPHPRRTLRDIFRIARKYVIVNVYGTHGRTRYFRNSKRPGVDYCFNKKDLLAWIPCGWQVVEFNEIERPIRDDPYHLIHQYLARRVAP